MFSSSSKILFGCNCWNTPKVIQKGRTNPIKNTSIQNAIPPINKKSANPKKLMLLVKFDYAVKVENKFWNKVQFSGDFPISGQIFCLRIQFW